MSLMNAVFLKTLYGAPVSLSFLTISVDSSTERTVPVAAIRKPGFEEEKDWKQQNPVLGAIKGPYIVLR